MDIDAIWATLDNFLEDNKKDEQKYKCDCNNDSNIIYHGLELICEECGIVVSKDNISHEAEWRNFNNDNGDNSTNKSRVSKIDDLLPESSTRTYIQGNTYLNKINNWNKIPYEEKVLINLKGYLEEIINKANLPESIIRHTMYDYAKLRKNNKKIIFRGKNKIGIISVCFYYTCRNNKCNISTHNICKIFDIDKKFFSKNCKIYLEMTNYSIEDIPESPETLLTLVINKLNIEYKIEKICKKIIYVIKEINLFVSSIPQSIVGAIIGFVNNELNLNIDIDKIAEICEVSNYIIIKNTKILVTYKQRIYNMIKQMK